MLLPEPAAVAGAVQRAFGALPKTGKPQPNEHTVLAGIVAFDGSQGSQQQQRMHVVALGTGTKCLGASKRSPSADVINDSHAEAVARRAFVAWVHHELALACAGVQPHAQQPQPGCAAQAHTRDEQQAQPPPPRPAFAWCPERCRQRFQLHEDIGFALYVSTPPCGDASVFGAAAAGAAPSLQQQPLPQAAAGGGQHVSEAAPRQQPSQQQLQPQAAAGDGQDGSAAAPEQQQQQQQQPAAAGRTGAKLLKMAGAADVAAAAAATREAAPPPEASAGQGQLPQPSRVPGASDVEAGPQQLGVLRRKPGKGDPTLSLSCSDKIARWACLGLQGCLLSSLLAAPLQLSLVVISAPPAAGQPVQQAQPGGAGAAAAPAELLAAVEAAGRRAFDKRLASCGGVLQPPFALAAPVVRAVPAPGAELGLSPGGVRTTPSGVSINWSCQRPLLDALAQQPPAKASAAAAAGTHEVTLAAHGRKAGAPRRGPGAHSAKTRSRLCSAALFERWRELVAALPGAGGEQQAAAGATAQPATALAQVRAAKARHGAGYQAAWRALRDAPGSAFAGWLDKP